MGRLVPRRRIRSRSQSARRFSRGDRPFGRQARRARAPAVRHPRLDRQRSCGGHLARHAFDGRLDAQVRIRFGSASLAGRLFVPRRLRLNDRRDERVGGCVLFCLSTADSKRRLPTDHHLAGRQRTDRRDTWPTRSPLTCAAGPRVLESRGLKLRPPKIKTSSKLPPSTRGRKRRSGFALAT